MRWWERLWDTVIVWAAGLFWAFLFLYTGWAAVWQSHSLTLVWGLFHLIFWLGVGVYAYHVFATKQRRSMSRDFSEHQ